MRRGFKGGTLPETAIVMSVVLLVLFGAVQLAIIGYSQLMADGAAFVGARSVAENPQGTSSTDQANARSAVGNVFSHLPSGSVAAQENADNTVTSSIGTSVPGLPVPGAPSTVSVNSRVVEPLIPHGTPKFIPGPYPFTASATLANDYQYAVNGSQILNHPIWLAQTVASYGGVGTTGRFFEWNCHLTYYQRLQGQFPAAAASPSPAPTSCPKCKPTNVSPRPSPASSPYAALNPTSTGTNENVIYSWDASADHRCVSPS
jgi:Flp pilus assembly protein TadG